VYRISKLEKSITELTDQVATDAAVEEFLNA
jgi:hypothetical protein